MSVTIESLLRSGCHLLLAILLLSFLLVIVLGCVAERVLWNVPEHWPVLPGVLLLGFGLCFLFTL